MTSNHESHVPRPQICEEGAAPGPSLGAVGAPRAAPPPHHYRGEAKNEGDTPGRDLQLHHDGLRHCLDTPPTSGLNEEPPLAPAAGGLAISTAAFLDEQRHQVTSSPSPSPSPTPEQPNLSLFVANPDPFHSSTSLKPASPHLNRNLSSSPSSSVISPRDQAPGATPSFPTLSSQQQQPTERQEHPSQSASHSPPPYTRDRGCSIPSLGFAPKPVNNHHKSLRPFARAIMAFEQTRKFSTGTSVHRKRQMSTLAEKEGHFGPALTVRWSCSTLYSLLYSTSLCALDVVISSVARPNPRVKSLGDTLRCKTSGGLVPSL
jgi:hypothetical protein